MSNPVTPLDGFTHLTDRIPSWFTKLDDLTVQVAEQNARFIRASQFSDHLEKKHNSTESLRPIDDDDINNSTAFPTNIYVPSNPSHACLSHDSRPKAAANNALVAAEIRRKRKNNSTHSDVSGHARYRTKSMTIVYYDSAIQEAFESLVRSIAGARNTLRKGKNSASFKARMASLGLDESPFSSPTKFKLMGPKLMRPGTGSHFGRDPLTDNGGACFEEADKNLEKAQNLCEVAAHQFLRDGDCRHEINGTRDTFEKCLEVAKKEVERLRTEEAREEAEEAAKRQARSEETPAVEVDIPPNVPIVVDYMDEKAEAKMEPTAITSINLPGAGTIEIDDGSDTESVHIDLSAFRRTRRV